MSGIPQFQANGGENVAPELPSAQETRADAELAPRTAPFALLAEQTGNRCALGPEAVKSWNFGGARPALLGPAQPFWGGPCPFWATLALFGLARPFWGRGGPFGAGVALLGLASPFSGRRGPLRAGVALSGQPPPFLARKTPKS